jgi:serine protease Do
MTHKWFESSNRAGWLAGAVAGASLVLATLFVNFSPDADAQSVRSAVPAGASSFADVVESVQPAVVNISVSKMAQAMPTSAFPGSQRPGNGSRGQLPEQFPFEFFERFFDMPGRPGVPQQRRTEGQGSGFIVDAEGYIVTNNHVIDGADKIVVTLQDGGKLNATLVGQDPKTDLALIKVDSSGGLPYVAFGDSDGARVGDWVLAIGNPFGLGGTATAGIISARGRDIQSGPYDDYLQIDAPINLGNSGGPVFDVTGQVVGVNTAIFSPNGGNVGIGFAIPANQAKSVIAALKTTGTVERGWLGVQIQDLDEDLVRTLGLDNDQGALVADVLGDGPAAEAGMRAGDVITRFNDRGIDSARTLSRVVADSNPADTADVTVWRDGRSQKLRVKLGEVQNTAPVAAAAPTNVDGPSALGLTLQALTEAHKAQLGLPAGVEGALVTGVEPDSAAAEKGIRPGDVITKVNDDNVNSVNSAIAALNEARADDSAALLMVRRGDSQRFVALSFS